MPEKTPPRGNVALRLQWLGQAGFLIETRAIRMLIDPYLSDSLAEKYRGTQFPHQRMVPVPIRPEDLRGIDLFFSTHGHTDHLDPSTILPVAKANPDCRFIVPASCADLAVSRGVPVGRLVPADAFSAFRLGDISVCPVPSAHETLAMDEAGHHMFLGYVLSIADFILYHSGDCAPYPGMLKNLGPFDVDLALLPINGRDSVRKTAGILGNFTLDEAADLAEAAGFRCAIGHHFGMFDFNTIDPDAARKRLAERGKTHFHIARTGVGYDFVAED